MDVSKLSISCLAKRYRLVCRNVETRSDYVDGHGAFERFHCRGTSNRGIMGIVCCWISIQAASSQQWRRTSHFFRFGDRNPASSLAVSPRLLIGFIFRGKNFEKLSKVVQASLIRDSEADYSAWIAIGIPNDKARFLTWVRSRLIKQLKTFFFFLIN